MERQQAVDDSTGIVQRYFELIRALRAGEQSSVDGLMELWDPEGTFEFAGTPPVVGTFKGAAAIRALYKNRVNSGNMKVAIMGSGKGEEVQKAGLGVVDTDIKHIRKDRGRALVGWRTTVGTREGTGFDVAGSHVFTFRKGKIRSLRVTISPKPMKSLNTKLTLGDFSVQDVGRLSLAAWAVV